MEQLYLRFWCMCFISTELKQTKQTDGSWCEALKRSTAVDVTLTASRCTSFRSACCLLLFWFVSDCETQTDKRQLMSLKQTRNCSTVDVEHRTVYVLFCFFAFKHGEREFTAKMSQHMFWRATSKMSEWKTFRWDDSWNLSGSVLGRTLFFFGCVWGLKQFQ